ncbi:MAG: META domain-containing protein [Chloroflexi bacterium]|nr:META domain-containing protein [Chloroflexota bacterium]
MRHTILWLTVVGWALAGCTAVDPGAAPAAASDKVPPALVGTTWRLVALDAAGTLQPAAGSAPITAQVINEGTLRLSGSAGCNTYNAPLDLSTGGFVVGNVATTRKACQDDAVMQQERRFVAMLARAQTATVREGQLEILDAQGTTILVFAAEGG